MSYYLLLRGPVLPRDVCQKERRSYYVYDIYDDCVRRYVNDAQTKSDAVVCAQLCPICPARGWGVVWLVISMGLWAGGVCYLVLHVGGHLDL